MSGPPTGPRDRPFLLGVAGGTGSGKTTVAERLAAMVGQQQLALMKLDSYYCDRADLSFEERAAINYDHPDAFDWPLLMAHLDELVSGSAAPVPVYDFADYLRTDQVIMVEPGPVVVIEGILVLFEPRLRELLDLKVYVDTDPDVRFIRRPVSTSTGAALIPLPPMSTPRAIGPGGGSSEPLMTEMVARIAAAAQSNDRTRATSMSNAGAFMPPCGTMTSA